MSISEQGETSPLSLPGLPGAVSATLERASVKRALGRGQELYGAGSYPNAMFGVLKGKISVSVYSEDGQRFFADILWPGEWFGEVPLFDGLERSFSVEGLEDSEIAILYADQFWRIVRADSEALLALTRQVCGRFRRALQWIEDASLQPVPARLASRLLALAVADPSRRKELHIVQEDLAAQLGVARQTVNRQLRKWEQQGMLRLSYGRVDVLDLQALRTASSRNG